MTLFIPRGLTPYLTDFMVEKDTLGMSGSSVYGFTSGDSQLFLKVDTLHVEFFREIQMLQWLASRLPVPKVVTVLEEGHLTYLLLTRAHGTMAEHCLDEPAVLARGLAHGIQTLQAVDMTDCPFTNTLDVRLALAKQNIDNGEVDMDSWNEEPLFGAPRFSSPLALYDYLVTNKPPEDLVFCHGDYCLPNVFLDGDRVSGFIDVGRAGIADTYQDIALAVRSLIHELEDSEPYVNLFFKALNLEPDVEKLRYYILLDELF